jgi:hypothetical protein
MLFEDKGISFPPALSKAGAYILENTLPPRGISLDVIWGKNMKRGKIKKKSKMFGNRTKDKR